jgi:hypothetical protein
VDAGHVDAGRVDRRHPDLADDVLTLLGDGVQPRLIRSSLSAAAGMPYTSSTAKSRALSTTPTSGDGLVNRLAINASITCPRVTLAVATSRIGHSRSTISRMPSRRLNSAATGKAPNAFCTTGASAYCARGRPAARTAGNFVPGKRS